MRLLPSISISVLFVITAGCTRPNPDFCCVTADTCAAAGLGDERRPCEVGQACRSYECVAAECTTAADCLSADSPACVNGLCVASCTVDDDCAGNPSRSHCDPVDAICVGCTSDDQCPADKAFCDADTRSCRGCTADDQCASGVCIEATGLCAADEEIIYVMETGIDEGTCQKFAPCKTIPFALGLTSINRNVVRILGGSLYLGINAIYLADVVIDGSNTTLTSAASPAIVSGGALVLEGIRLLSSSNSSSTPLAKVLAGGNMVLIKMEIEGGQIEVVSGGMLRIADVRLRNSDIECRVGGSLSVKRINFEQGYWDSKCSLVLSGSRLEPTPSPLPSIYFQGPSQLIENNIFIGHSAEAFLMLIGGGAGSTFRFNTVVNTSSVIGSMPTIGCLEGVNVTSNIIAFNSTRPIEPCFARHSLFDATGVQAVDRGFGNRSADITTFFKDRQAGDFHLPADSPAIGFGEPGLLTTDLDGNPRPIPAGSLPDVGAYEAP